MLSPELLEVSARQMRGEQITQVEFDDLNERHIRYELVRTIYTEKMRHEGELLVDFHFTPKDNFMEIPIYDLVHELVQFSIGVKNGTIEVKELDFGDSHWKEA